MPDGFDRNLVDPDDVIEQRRSALFGGVFYLKYCSLTQTKVVKMEKSYYFL